MYIYGYFNDDINKISLSSIKYLSKQLNDFIMLYEKYILIQNEKDYKTLNELKKISYLLNQGRYNELIANPDMIINYNDDNEDYLPIWYPN